MSLVIPKPLPNSRLSLSVMSHLSKSSALRSKRTGSSKARSRRSGLNFKRKRWPSKRKFLAPPTIRFPSNSVPSPWPTTKPKPAGATSNFQVNSGSVYRAPGSMKSASRASGIIAILRLPELACAGIECETKAVADAIRKHLLDVRADLLAGTGRKLDVKEGIVLRRGAVVIESDHHSGEVSIVGFRSAELIVHSVRTQRDGNVLHPATATVVANVDVKIAIGPEEDLAAIMVSAQGLSLVCLIRAQTDDVHVHRQRRTVPNETVYAIAKKGNLSGIARVVGPASAILAERRRAAGPIEIHEAVVCEVGVESDA